MKRLTRAAHTPWLSGRSGSAQSRVSFLLGATFRDSLLTLVGSADSRCKLPAVTEISCRSRGKGITQIGFDTSADRR